MTTPIADRPETIAPAPAPADPRETLHALLDEALGYGPEYGSLMASHLPMALHALSELGATPAQMRRFFDHDAKHLEARPAQAAVAVFAETASEDDIEELARRHEEAIAAVERDGLTPGISLQLEELEDLLHGSIVAILNNPLADTAYRRVHNYLKLVRLDRKVTVPLVLRSLHEHQAIIEACRNRSATDAVAALQAHFAAALQRNLGLY